MPVHCQCTDFSCLSISEVIVSPGPIENVYHCVLPEQMLDMTFTLGLTPVRFANFNGLEAYFAMARGASGVGALDISKFFDTNYHYLVSSRTASCCWHGFAGAPQQLLKHPFAHCEWHLPSQFAVDGLRLQSLIILTGGYHTGNEHLFASAEQSCTLILLWLRLDG